MRVDSVVQDYDALKVLTVEIADRLIKSFRLSVTKGEDYRICVSSKWRGGQRWARNKSFLTSDQRTIAISLGRALHGTVGAYVDVNQIDVESLKNASDYMGIWINKFGIHKAVDMWVQPPTLTSSGITPWSESTFNRTPSDNADEVKKLVTQATSDGLMSAGYIETVGANSVVFSMDQYGQEYRRTAAVTQAQCSITVRSPKGNASGWAGGSSFDLKTLDLGQIARLALDKCVRSADPVRIEPGRYQVVLEPQATSPLAGSLLYALNRFNAETNPGSPFALNRDESIGRWRTKLGLRILDERFNMYHDPSDPIMGTHKSEGLEKVQYIKDGVLVSLYDSPGRRIVEVFDSEGQNIERKSTKIEGTETDISELILSTTRGLLVTRFVDYETIDNGSLLATGITRDGLWLIEKGKITKSVRNLRFTESPLFAFNNIEQIGKSVLTFNPSDTYLGNDLNFHDSLHNLVVPALRINDFSFTSTVDAI